MITSLKIGWEINAVRSDLSMATFSDSKIAHSTNMKFGLGQNGLWMDETGTNFDKTPQSFVPRVYVVKNSIFTAFIPHSSFEKLDALIQNMSFYSKWHNVIIFEISTSSLAYERWIPWILNSDHKHPTHIGRLPDERPEFVLFQNKSSHFKPHLLGLNWTWIRYIFKTKGYAKRG